MNADLDRVLLVETNPLVRYGLRVMLDWARDASSPGDGTTDRLRASRCRRRRLRR